MRTLTHYTSELDCAVKSEGISDHARLLLAETKIFGTMDIPRLVQDVDAIIRQHPKWGIAYAVRSLAKSQLGQQAMSMEWLKDAATDADRARTYLPDNPFPLVASLNAYNYLIQLANHEGSDTTEFKTRAGSFAAELERWPNVMPGTCKPASCSTISQMRNRNFRLSGRGSWLRSCVAAT